MDSSFQERRQRPHTYPLFQTRDSTDSFQTRRLGRDHPLRVASQPFISSHLKDQGWTRERGDCIAAGSHLHLQMASFARERAVPLIEANFEAVWRTWSSTLPGSKRSATRPAERASSAEMGVPNKIICIAYIDKRTTMSQHKSHDHVTFTGHIGTHLELANSIGQTLGTPGSGEQSYADFWQAEFAVGRGKYQVALCAATPQL